MKELLRRFFNQQFIGVLALLFLLVGLIASPVMMSIGVIGLAMNWVINIAKAESLLNYSPEYDLINGLQATLQNEEGPHDVQPS